MPTEGEARPFSKADALARGSKRTPRERAGRARWEQIVRAKGSRCRLCQFVDEHPSRAADLGIGRYERLGVSYHHLWQRSRLGDDTEGNVVPLCGSGTTGHHGKVTANDRAHLRALAESLTDLEIAWLADHVGENWPERVFLVRYEPA